MIEAVLGHSAFGAVVVGVAILRIVVALILAIRRRDALSEERGGLWVFHGETDTSPHQMPGARFEDRHVIDPDVAERPPRLSRERSVLAPPAFSARRGSQTAAKAARAFLREIGPTPAGREVLRLRPRRRLFPGSRRTTRRQARLEPVAAARGRAADEDAVGA
jgi:hypothetical protein